MRKFAILSGLIAVCAVSPAIARKPPQIGGLELQQMQARDFEVSKSVSFPAVMTVLQDSGYRVAAADRDTGLITASASTNSHMAYSLFGGFGRSKKTPVVSVFVEDRGPGSRVRLNFVMAKTKSSVYGMSSSDEEPILDPVVYQTAFEKIQKEIFVRQALASPAAPANPVSAVPASPPVPAATPVTSASASH